MGATYSVFVYVFLRRSIFIIYEIFIHSRQFCFDAAIALRHTSVLLGRLPTILLMKWTGADGETRRQRKNNTLLVLFSTRTRDVCNVWQQFALECAVIRVTF